jgi:TolA-binding protein
MKNDFEELAVAARRGELSKSGAEELKRELDAAPDERIWQQAGLRFDAEESRAASDDAVAGRLLERVMAGQPSPLRQLEAPPRARRVRPAVLLIAAAVLVASAAAAVVGIVHLRETPPSKAPPAPSSTSSASSSSGRAPNRVPAREREPAPSPEPSAAPVEPPPSARPPSASEEAPQPAAELLSSAGRARRKGEATRAIGLLEQLQARFPASAEARASDITLGMLRLQTGASSTALRDFERYLARSPGGDRTADALWGRAKALLALGRRSEAEASLRQLLARYPQSPYTSAARAELHEGSP